MTVSTEISSNEYTGNGVTTDFDYKFRIFKANQLSVITSDADGDNVVTLRLGTDYTVTGENKSAGGKVILTKPLANGHKISIARDIPIKQETSFRNQSKFFAETHEDAFDYLTMIIQRIWGSLGSLYLKRPNILANWFDAKGYRIANLGKPKCDSDAVNLGTLKDEIEGVNSTVLKREKRLLRVDDMDITALPDAVERAGKVITFDENGNPIAVAPASGSAIDVLNELASDYGSKLVHPCTDIHTLRSLSGLKPGQEINLLGYHSFGSGIGGGKLYVSDDNVSPDDGFTCFVTNDGKRVKRSKDTILTVTMAGAIGDGIHFEEDTVGFQRAADKGISVLVPQPEKFYGIGEFTEWKGIIPANSGTVFYSFSNAHIKLVSSRCNIFSNFERDFYVQTGSPITDFVIDGLHLDGDMQNLADPASDDFKIGDNYSFGVYMVVMPESKNVTVKNCHIENFWYGGTNLFGVPNQTTENVTYNNIGSPTAYFPNYAAAGSDASWRFTNWNVKYDKIRIKDCGGGIRANHGINNGQSPLSENWLFNDVEIRDSVTGINVYGGQFNDIKFRDCNFFNISKGRVISVTGEGDKWNRDSRVGNVSLDGIGIYNCNTDDTANAMVYVYASSGLCPIRNLKIIGGGNTRTHSVVLGGEYINGSVSSTASFILDKIMFAQSSLVATHILSASVINLSSCDCTHASSVSTRVYQLTSGCSVDIRDSKVTIPNFDTSKFIQRNWSKGSVRNIIGFKTKASGIGEYKDGDKIAHGLVDNPVYVSAIKRVSGDPLIISATSSVNEITLRMFNWNGTATATPQTVSWEAYTWHEVNI